MEEAEICIQLDDSGTSDTNSLSDLPSSHRSMSETSECMTSVTDISIYHEFDCIIAELHAIQGTQHEALEALHRIQGGLHALDDRVMIYDEVADDMFDLDEIIDRLHNESMKAIENGSKDTSTFINQLLEWIERIPSEE